MLGHDWDAKLPQVYLLVIGGGDESFAVLDEGDRVDRAEVLLVLLDDLAGVGVELHNLFV